MTPYSFTVSLWFPCMLGTFGERTTLVPRDQKKNQTKGSQTMGVWLINHTASLSNMETTASERQSLSMHDFPIYPKSSTTLSNLFVPFCTQTEPVNKGIQNLTCPSIQTKHVARLVRSCTARLNSSSVINDDIDNIHTFVLLRYFLQRGIPLGSGEELFHRLSKFQKKTWQLLSSNRSYR